MGTRTPNLGLIKPDGSDPVLVEQLNENFDKLDEAYGGAAGGALRPRGTYSSLQALKKAVTNPEQGDIYQVGTKAPYELYMWDGGKWLDIGRMQGESAFVWIQYASDYPTANSDMHSTPDKYMGIYTGREEAAPEAFSAYSWYQIKGEKGDKGDKGDVGAPFLIKGTAYPTLQELQDAISEPEEGDQYNVGSAPPYHIYRWTGTAWEDQGVLTTDGAVKSVNGLKPAADGNVEISAGEVDAYTKEQTDSQIENQAPIFTRAENRANIASGEKLTVLFGKIMKWFADLKAVAFSGSYDDLTNKPTIPAASSTSPKAAGTAAVGSETAFARGDHTHPAQTTVTGNAGTATKLATARAFRTNLGSTATANFDGSAACNPGVTGTLGLGNGGTGATTAAAARETLGAFGWIRALTASDNLNNITAPGVYTYATNAYPTNAPYQSPSIVEVAANGGGTIVIQRVTRYAAAGQSAFRVLGASGTWTAWMSLATQTMTVSLSDDAPPVLEQLRADIDFLAAMQGVEL